MMTNNPREFNRVDGLGVEISPNSNLILEIATKNFIASARTEQFNGITASGLVNTDFNQVQVRDYLSELVRAGVCNCTFASAHINPHIKRMPDLAAEKQIELIKSENLSAICVYPSREILLKRIGIDELQFKPFSRELMLATPQLEYVSFELAVLERYCNDPRYKVDFHDYMGRMSILDSYYMSGDTNKRDKVHLQTFGLGLSKNKEPAIVAFLRYLSDLSPEHQQHWNSYRKSEQVKITKQYFDSSIGGKFWKNQSATHGLVEEIRIINEMTMRIWNVCLFRTHIFPPNAIALTSFLRPTQHNFEQFCQNLDKLISENIEKSFFKKFGQISLTSIDTKGKEQQKGTIQLIKEWLLNEGSWESEELLEQIIIGPLREVRRLRQKPAHSLTINQSSIDFFEKRRKLIWTVFNSLSNIRQFLGTHSLASDIKVPEWLNGEEFDVF